MNNPTPDALIEQLLASVRQENIPAKTAVKYVDQVLSTFRRISLIGQDEAYVRSVLESIGESYEALGSLAKATEVLCEALELAVNQQDASSQANLQWKLGRVYRKRSQWDDAIQQIQSSRHLHEDIGDQVGIARCWNSEGLIYGSQGAYQDAENAFQRAIQQSETIGDRRIAADASMNLGILAVARGDFERAVLLYQNSLSTYEQLNLQEAIARIHLNLGRCFIQQEQWPDALDALEKSLTIVHESGSLFLTAVNYIQKAFVYLELKDPSIAAQYCAQAIDICNEIDYPQGTAEAYRVLGKMYTAKGDRITAHSLLSQSLSLFEQYNEPLEQARTRREIALYQISIDARDEAGQTLAEALAQFDELGAQHDSQVTREIIDAL